MKKLLCLVCFICGCSNIPAKILDSIVLVNNSSGVVVYSNGQRTLILSANHVIESDMIAYGTCRDTLPPASGNVCIYPTKISIYEQKTIKTFDVNNIELDDKLDLALIEIKTDRIFTVVNISTKEYSPGDKIFTAGNPINIYHSIKQGIISSSSEIDDSGWVYEVQGSVIFGMSGGGLFDTNGNLIGTLLSVARKPMCNNKGVCIDIPFTEFGFARPTVTSQDFLLSSSYGPLFEYLRPVKTYSRWISPL